MYAVLGLGITGDILSRSTIQHLETLAIVIPDNRKASAEFPIPACLRQTVRVLLYGIKISWHTGPHNHAHFSGFAQLAGNILLFGDNIIVHQNCFCNPTGANSCADVIETPIAITQINIFAEIFI